MPHLMLHILRSNAILGSDNMRETMPQATLTKGAEERLLLHWIDSCFEQSGPVLWQCSASQLRRFLTRPQRGFSAEARELLSSPQLIGIYLARLAKLFPTRFQRVHISTQTFWRITGPCD
jgi:hypothetical protein